jgi:hypothetical protein
VTEDLQQIARRLGEIAPRFPVLADERRAVARDYGVYRAFSRDGIGVTRPAVFLIDQGMTLRFVYVGDGEGDVVDTDALMHLCQALLGAKSGSAQAAASTAEAPVEASAAPTEGKAIEDEQPTGEVPLAKPGEGSPESTDEAGAPPDAGDEEPLAVAAASAPAPVLADEQHVSVGDERPAT